jgi:Amt family ammonium transporter
MPSTELDSTWLLFSAFLVMLMQAGFCLLETGLVRAKNSTNIAFKNLADFCVSGITFWMVGYGLMFGLTANGWFGTSHFFYQHSQADGAWFLFQLMFCATATTIVGGALAERTGFIAYLFISVLIAGLIYPLVGHWIWGGMYGNGDPGWLAQMNFIDFAGGTAVHTVGGFAALAAAIIVGPRLGRFTQSEPIRGGNLPLSAVGLLILCFGWFGFNTGSAGGYSAEIPQIAINTVLAAMAGCLTLMTWQVIRTRQPSIHACINGTLAGLVGVTPAPQLYSTLDAIIVGCLCAIAANLAGVALERCKIDDPIGAFPVHGVAGVAGALLVALFGDIETINQNGGRLDQLQTQLIGVMSVVMWSFGLTYVLLGLLDKVLPLRVSAANETVGLNISEHNESTDLIELMSNMNAIASSGLSVDRVAVEPHTEVGAIAGHYNQVLDRVQSEIEQREETNRKLREASSIQLIFDNARTGILLLAQDGSISQANPSAARILGFASTEKLISEGGKFLENMHFEERDSYRHFRELLEERGQIEEMEMVYERTCDRTVGYSNWSIHTIVSDNPADACYLLSTHDSWQQKENELLKTERDAAHQASQAKSQFLANMSHEIRTPLNGVIGMLELLHRTDLNNRQEDYVNTAHKSAESLLTVINDILDFSKIEAGKLEIDRVTFNLPQLLHDTIDMFAGITSRKSLELAGYIPPDLPQFVNGDPERIRQVLVNLLGNAVKFTEEGLIELRAASTVADDGTAAVTIAITDTGCGMSEAAMSKLFRSFSQADASTTRKYGGTGLGLAIARQLLQLMDGDITVQSEPDVGTTFTAQLSLTVVDESGELPDQLEHMTRLLNDRKVLIVDDHDVNRKYLLDLLAPTGADLSVADNGTEALVKIEQAHTAGKPVELLLTDYQMPSIHGVELITAIHKRFANATPVKTILLSSVDQIESFGDSQASAPDIHLRKPIRSGRLFDSIAELFNQPINQLPTHSSNDDENRPPAVIENPQDFVILLVEDNPINQMVATELLEQMGFTVETAEDGSIAVSRVTEGGIDLVFMDCQMPVMDGFDAASAIRRLNASVSAVPIVALTANALTGDREKCLDAGMDDYITKPIDPVELEQVLVRYLAGENLLPKTA